MLPSQTLLKTPYRRAFWKCSAFYSQSALYQARFRVILSWSDDL